MTAAAVAVVAGASASGEAVFSVRAALPDLPEALTELLRVSGGAAGEPPLVVAVVGPDARQRHVFSDALVDARVFDDGSVPHAVAGIVQICYSPARGCLVVDCGTDVGGDMRCWSACDDENENENEDEDKDKDKSAEELRRTAAAYAQHQFTAAMLWLSYVCHAFLFVMDEAYAMERTRPRSLGPYLVVAQQARRDLKRGLKSLPFRVPEAFADVNLGYHDPRVHFVLVQHNGTAANLARATASGGAAVPRTDGGEKGSAVASPHAQAHGRAPVGDRQLYHVPGTRVPAVAPTGQKADGSAGGGSGRKRKKKSNKSGPLDLEPLVADVIVAMQGLIFLRGVSAQQLRTLLKGDQTQTQHQSQQGPQPQGQGIGTAETRLFRASATSLVSTVAAECLTSPIDNLDIPAPPPTQDNGADRAEGADDASSPTSHTASSAAAGVLTEGSARHGPSKRRHRRKKGKPETMAAAAAATVAAPTPMLLLHHSATNCALRCAARLSRDLAEASAVAAAEDSYSSSAADPMRDVLARMDRELLQRVSAATHTPEVLRIVEETFWPLANEVQERDVLDLARWVDWGVALLRGLQLANVIPATVEHAPQAQPTWFADWWMAPLRIQGHDLVTSAAVAKGDDCGVDDLIDPLLLCTGGQNDTSDRGTEERKQQCPQSGPASGDGPSIATGSAERRALSQRSVVAPSREELERFRQVGRPCQPCESSELAASLESVRDTFDHAYKVSGAYGAVAPYSLTADDPVRLYVSHLPQDRAFYSPALHAKALRATLQSLHIDSEEDPRLAERVRRQCAAYWSAGLKQCAAVALSGVPCMRAVPPVEADEEGGYNPRVTTEELEQPNYCTAREGATGFHSTGHTVPQYCACGHTLCPVELQEEWFSVTQANEGVFLPCCTAHRVDVDIACPPCEEVQAAASTHVSPWEVAEVQAFFLEAMDNHMRFARLGDEGVVGEVWTYCAEHEDASSLPQQFFPTPVRTWLQRQLQQNRYHPNAIRLCYPLHGAPILPPQQTLPASSRLGATFSAVMQRHDLADTILSSPLGEEYDIVQLPKSHWSVFARPISSSSAAVSVAPTDSTQLDQAYTLPGISDAFVWNQTGISVWLEYVTSSGWRYTTAATVPPSVFMRMSFGNRALSLASAHRKRRQVAQHCKEEEKAGGAAAAAGAAESVSAGAPATTEAVSYDADTSADTDTHSVAVEAYHEQWCPLANQPLYALPPLTAGKIDVEAAVAACRARDIDPLETAALDAAATDTTQLVGQLRRVHVRVPPDCNVRGTSLRIAVVIPTRPQILIFPMSHTVDISRGSVVTVRLPAVYPSPEDPTRPITDMAALPQAFLCAGFLSTCVPSATVVQR